MSLGTQPMLCAAIGPHAHATRATWVDALIPSVTPRGYQGGSECDATIHA